MKTHEILLPKGWEVDKIVDGKIIIKEVTSKFPTTWEECLQILKSGEYISSLDSAIKFLPKVQVGTNNKNIIPAGLGEPLLAFIQLLVCREVYRQGWKPDWADPSTPKFIILVDNNCIESSYSFRKHFTFSFPTEEICEEFKTNFKDLLEIAKPLF